MERDPRWSCPIMRCADEQGYPEREFSPEIYKGKPTGDYTCSCGWMQRSFESGLIEVIDCLHRIIESEK